MGRRVRMIRQRRGLSIGVAAGLAGIDKALLSRLETGQRAFLRRGLLEDLAGALSCSVADITGQPYLVPDRRSARAARVIPALSIAVHDTTLDDAPEVPARPVAELARLAHQANLVADQVDYATTDTDLAAVMTELHVQATRSTSEDRRTALAALVEACMAAGGLAWTMGHYELDLIIARRGYDAAQRLERPDLVALTAMNRTHALMGIGARYQAGVVVSEAITQAEALPGPSRADTTLGEGRGMLHLSAALLGAKQHGDAGGNHLAEARSLAAFTGECNHMLYHFGPTNVALWELSIGVENGGGPETAERFLAQGLDLSILRSKDRVFFAHFDLARAWGHAGGARDTDAIRELDTADRIAPLRTRNDPLARDLAAELRRRAKRRVWELDSLCHRLGVT